MLNCHHAYHPAPLAWPVVLVHCLPSLGVLPSMRLYCAARAGAQGSCCPCACGVQPGQVLRGPAVHAPMVCSQGRVCRSGSFLPLPLSRLLIHSLLTGELSEPHSLKSISSRNPLMVTFIGCCLDPFLGECCGQTSFKLGGITEDPCSPLCSPWNLLGEYRFRCVTSVYEVFG